MRTILIASLLLLLIAPGVAVGEDLTAEMVAVVRYQTRVTTREGTILRHIPIGARFLVSGMEGEHVVLLPADPQQPPEFIERSCVVKASQAGRVLKARTETENTAAAWADYAEYLRQNDQFSDAFDCLTTGLERDRFHPRIYIELGREHERLGNDDEAQEAFKLAESIGSAFDLRFKPNRQLFAESHTISYDHPHVHGATPRTYDACAHTAGGFRLLGSASGKNATARLSDAVEHFHVAIGQDLNCLSAWCGLAKAYEAQGRIDDAILAVSAIIDRCPRDHVHLIDRAELWQKMGDLDRARRDFDAAVVIASACPCALRERATFFESQHELGPALTDLNRSLELDPDNKRIVDQRVRIQVSLGAYEGALADLELLRRIEPEARHMRPLEGMLWELKGDFAKAREVYRGLSVGSWDRCRLCMRQGDFAAALEDCDAMVADQQGRIAAATHEQERAAYRRRLIDARRARGYVLERLGRFDEALVDYTEWSSAVPTNRLAMVSRARVLKSLNQNDEAAAETARAMEIDKQTCTNFVARGLAKEVLGDLQGALDDYVTADRIHGKCGASLASIAWIHATAADASLRHGKNAVEEAERAIALKGAPVRRKDEILAAAYAEAGDFDKAVRQIEKCMKTRDSHGRRELMPVLDRYRRGTVMRSEPWEVYLP